VRLDLPVPVVRATRERCGQAAFEMVLRYWGADSAAIHEADRAYDPVLRGSLVTDLAAAARRAATPPRSSRCPRFAGGAAGRGRAADRALPERPGPAHRATLRRGARLGPAHGDFTVNDGGAKPRVIGRGALAERWRTAGSQALIVRRPAP